MKKTILLTLPLILLLGACAGKSEEKAGTSSSKQTEKTSSKTAKTSQSSSSSQKTETSTSVSSSESASSQENQEPATSPSANSQTTEGTRATSATSATFNGSYYTVQGKYGPVLIVNKKHPLSSSYAPGEIPEAQSAFYQLKAAMQGQGFAISDNYSGYRSYSHQAGLYQSYVNQDGQAAADTYSARPGYSEHQTGLAYDFIDSSGNLLEEPAASQWLRDNAHHYGFIVRYLPGKESITGYMAESWHIRYIGPEAADIYQSGLTLEEYFGVPGGGYE